MRTYSSEKKSFYRQRVLQMFLLISGGHIGAPIWRLHTKLYKGVWNVSENNSETVGHKDLRLGQTVYKLVFYNISFSWLLPLHGFQFIFLLRDSANDLYFKKLIFGNLQIITFFSYFNANKLSITWVSKKAYLKLAQKRVQQVKFMKYYIFLNKNKIKCHKLRPTTLLVRHSANLYIA